MHRPFFGNLPLRIRLQRRHGYRDFHEQPQHFRLVRWLYTRAWVSAERPMMLFDLATARLVKEKILLPGVTTLTRLVASVRDRAAARLWRILAGFHSPEQRGRLLSLLRPGESGNRFSLLDRMRRAPTRISAAGMLDALQRLSEFSSLRVGNLDLTYVPPGRLRALARYAAVSKAQAIERMPGERQIAASLPLPLFRLLTEFHPRSLWALASRPQKESNRCVGLSQDSSGCGTVKYSPFMLPALICTRKYPCRSSQ